MIEWLPTVVNHLVTHPTGGAAFLPSPSIKEGGHDPIVSD